MEFSNRGTSTYHRFVAHFVRDSTTLLRVSGPRSSELSSSWSYVQTQLSAPAQIRGLLRHDVKTESQSLSLFEKMVDGRYCGVAVTSDGTDNEIDAFVSTILIKQARFVFDTVPSIITPEVEATSNKLTDMFDTTLRYNVPGDMWKAQGRDVFYTRIEYFVSRNMPIELVLPAFPCKSSNTDKVTGPKPDRGEELALRRLHNFVAELEQLYKPGGKLLIVSDGHVFSDCIGVDDDEVDTYTAQLIEMNNKVAAATKGEHRVGFFGLVDLFDLDSSAAGIEKLHSSLPIAELGHHVSTTLTPEAETCRQILMSGCACEASGVRARIDAKDPAILALYRGFARFMLEDLDLNKATKHLSKSQRRKISTKVAFEMILRNQAYSNLVELVFPHHVRLSIHAHKNSGPKFGIQLFDPAKVRTTDSLDALGKPMQCVDLLHIPTPWHNSVVEIEGSNTIYVTKSKLAREAVAVGRFTGGFERGPGAIGGCFRLKPTETTVSTPATPVVEVKAPVFARKSTPVVRIQIPASATNSDASKMQTPVKTPAAPRMQTPIRAKAAVPSTPAAAQIVSPILARRGTLLDMDQDGAGEAGDKSLVLLGALADKVMNVVRANNWVWGSITGRSFTA
ncbi:pyoverdine dityrosine biosynthesis protein [Zalerion maritima]|uniref:Pyoverdine dityrosine biosynthesis protein n=1 Tax=Zalerion maritima TaxID=339359 RepID=A0AAD5RJ57_9PEZI|nr:pyoverdine dityrosine biosynthesis protein [Zalerion maritima]